MSEMPDEHNDELPIGCSVLCYNPCDGWHLHWTMVDRLEFLKALDVYVAWMPEPPEPTEFLPAEYAA